MMILLFILSLWSASVQAQEFSVAGFRLLPNDVSAFITPVRDLNDEPCALVKVEAPSDFAFSTPLGIVSRKDKVGEIWLYLPKGSKLLTIKHPEWGVLRDYRFSKPLESRMTYELKLKLPKPTPIIQEKHDTIVEVKTVIDTIAVPQVRKKMPLALYTLATLSLHEDGRTVLWSLLRPDAPPRLLHPCQQQPQEHRQHRGNLQQRRLHAGQQHQTLLYRQYTPPELHLYRWSHPPHHA